MIHRFALPDLGEGIAEGEVVEWLVQPGQTVAADEPIAQVSTDKVDIVVPSPVAGVVKALCVEAGQVVPVGTVLAEIVAEPEGAGVRRAANGVRATAVESGLREGRETIARRLTQAATVPVVTQVDEADFEAVRAAGYAPLPAVARAAVLALGGHPELNAWGREDGSRQEHEGVQLGIATHTSRGLVVPVIRDAERLTTDGLADEIAALSAAVRMGRAGPEAFGGSTFTMSSAGRLAGMFATPLLNLPEVAILGLHRVEQRAVVRDGAVVARHTAHLSVSFDHRAVDGIHAARFLSRVIGLLEAWPLPPAGTERGA